jgi:GLPGLI family protein
MLLLPAAVSAQEGRIAYSRSVQFDYELPEGMPEQMLEQFPRADVAQLLLFFTPTESIMVSAPEPEEQVAPGGERNRRLQGFAERMRRTSTSRSDQEELLGAYINFDTSIMAETRSFLGRTFLISQERPKLAWSLGTEQRQYLDFVVQKATTEHQGRSVEAWYTMQIPVPGGPGPYGGLPGMVLLVSIDDGHTVYAASDVELEGLRGYTISEPTAGEIVTPEEYEEIVAEKLAELETMRSSRGGDRRRPF